MPAPMRIATALGRSKTMFEMTMFRSLELGQLTIVSKLRR
jgi:hypothetical protein